MARGIAMITGTCRQPGDGDGFRALPVTHVKLIGCALRKSASPPSSPLDLRRFHYVWIQLAVLGRFLALPPWSSPSPCQRSAGRGLGERHKRGGRQGQERLPGVTASSPRPLLQGRRGRPSRRLVAVSKCARRVEGASNALRIFNP